MIYIYDDEDHRNQMPLYQNSIGNYYHAIKSTSENHCVKYNLFIKSC